MRPKKRVLLIDTDEDRRGQLGFMLRTNGFATPECADGTIALIIARDPEDVRACLELKLFCRCPLLVISSTKVAPIVIGADAGMTASISNREFLELVKVMSARKRGPRKRPPQAAFTPQPATQVATA